MYCEVNGKRIDSSIQSILSELRKESGNWYFDSIEQSGSDRLKITCPNHKNGKERHPSCYIFTKNDDPDIEYGTCHCFTCGYVARLPKLVSDVLNISQESANEWLTDGHSTSIISSMEILPRIDIVPKKEAYLDKSELEKYKGYHEYMWKRKLSKEVVDFFHIGYNKEHNSIMFPVWDEHNNLVMFTERYIDSKKFHIPSSVTKPIYLLNFIIQYNYTTVVVCESQFNALTSWTYGKPAIALFGTGTKHQYEILNKSGIRHYILMFDGDEAGRKGAERFKKNIRKDVMVTDIVMPDGSDVNDLYYNQFMYMLSINGC